MFIADARNSYVVELPKTPTGFGPPTILPFQGLSGTAGIAVDGAGNVFVDDLNNDRLVKFAVDRDRLRAPDHPADGFLRLRSRNGRRRKPEPVLIAAPM